MSNFSYYCSVFKRLVLQTRKNQGLFGKAGFILERAISAYVLQMAHRKSHEGADPAHKFSGKNLLCSEFIPHKNVGIHLPSTA